MLNNNEDILSKAQELYESKEYRTLESLFSTHLRQSYSLDFWHLYIEYVRKVSQKSCNLLDVYEFTISHFEHFWDSAELYKEYIEEINKIEDEHLRIEKTRNAYLKAFHTPMHKINTLWKEFETYELDNNKVQSKKVITEALPIYQATFQYYQVILPFITNLNKSNAYKFMDLEHENRHNLNPKMLTARLNFIYNFMIYSFRSEEFYFLYSEFLIKNNFVEKAKRALDPVLDTSLFLKVYYGYMSSDSVFRSFVDSLSTDVVTINYLNFVLKNQGLEAFRRRFIEYKDKAGAHVFIFVAQAEFYVAQNRTSAFNIFNNGLNKFPSNELLGEKFFTFLLKIGDEENARVIFKRIIKTEKVWNKMIEYEFLYGCMDKYRELIENKAACENIRSTKNKKVAGGSGCIVKYNALKDAYSFMGLKLDGKNLLDSFINELPKLNLKHNILSNVPIDSVIQLLKEIN